MSSSDHGEREPKPKCKHPWCRKGLFYDVSPPLHSHSQCHSCHQMARCKDSKSDTGKFQLKRCANCCMDQYCVSRLYVYHIVPFVLLTLHATEQSRECQKEAWKRGHKELCKYFSTIRNMATDFSKNTNAWSDLTDWVKFHHTTLLNATLTCYLYAGKSFPAVADEYFLYVEVDYRNDSSLPVEKCFKPQAIMLISRAHTRPPGAREIVAQQYPVGVEMSKREYGQDYAGTGSYLIFVRFAPDNPQLSKEPIPFAKHFGIPLDYTRVRPACWKPVYQLYETLDEGRKLNFCCAKFDPAVHGDCCCGGWTHQKVGCTSPLLCIRTSLNLFVSRRKMPSLGKRRSRAWLTRSTEQRLHCAYYFCLHLSLRIRFLPAANVAGSCYKNRWRRHF